jgi:broad specificity phosphatase PhoE
MKYFLPVLLLLLASCSHSYFIVRHAERADQNTTGGSMMAADPPLSDDGKARALVLKELLKNKDIRYIFCTNTIRSKATAQPLADYLNIQPEIYKPMPDSAFISKLKALKKNVLIIAHSNTMDDIVNLLCGKKEVPGDLKDTDYDNLFIIQKKGKQYRFSHLHYGKWAH